jgi:hypothetical protein
VGERGEADTALPPGHQRSPFQRKSSRGRLECDRVGCNAGPNVPQGQRFGNMRVLDRPLAAGESRENSRSIAEESEPEQAGRVKETLDHCVKRAERKTVARRKRLRRQPVFRARAMIAGAERDCVKPRRFARDDPPPRRTSIGRSPTSARPDLGGTFRPSGG